MNARTARVRAPQAFSVWLGRVLFPSWRFFEAEDARFLLEVRTRRSGEAPSAFVPAVPAARRNLVVSWLFAPEHNLRLFCHDLIEHFVFELGEQSPLAESEIEGLASYARVREIARYFVREALPPSLALSQGERGQDSGRYQLRLLAVRADESTEELFVSPSYEIDG